METVEAIGKMPVEGDKPTNPCALRGDDGDFVRESGELNF
jgi:hypothetical protein